MDSNIRGTPNLLFLQVEEIDKYVFVDSVCSLSFWVFDLETNLPRTGEHWLVNVTIAYDQPYLECGQNAIDVISCSGIDASGYGKVQFKIRDVSMNHGNKRFCLIFDASNPSTTQTLRGQTNPFVCVRHKLVIREENQTPYAWYKDEGGKDKSIEFHAILIDAHNTVVLGRMVPLRAVLMYYGGQPVLQQSILTVSPDSRAAIDESGTAKIKFRINEVSTRHRGQLFQVLISPHFNDDISPALSMPVEVRSKRNPNTKRDASQISASAASAVPSPPMYPLSAVGGMLPPDSPYSFGGYALPPPLVAAAAGGSEEYLESDVIKRARLAYAESSGLASAASAAAAVNSSGVLAAPSAAATAAPTSALPPSVMGGGIGGVPTTMFTSAMMPSAYASANPDVATSWTTASSSIPPPQGYYPSVPPTATAPPPAVPMSSLPTTYTILGTRQPQHYSQAPSVQQQQQQPPPTTHYTTSHRTSPSSVALSDLSAEKQYEQYINSFRSIVLWTHKVLSSLQGMQWLQIGYDGSSDRPGGGGLHNNNLSSTGSVSSVGSGGSGDDPIPSGDIEVDAYNPRAPKLFNMTNPNERIKDIIEMYRNSAKGSLECMKQFIEGHHHEHQQYIQMKGSSPPSAAVPSAAAAVAPATEWSVPQPRANTSTKTSSTTTTTTTTTTASAAVSSLPLHRPIPSGHSVHTATGNSSLHSIANAAVAAAAAAATSSVSEEEQAVNLVLAKSVLFAGCFLGTPVFNVQGTTVTCVGFYECYSHNNVAKINFHSLKSQVQRLSLKMDKVVAHIQSLLSAETSIDSGNGLYHLSECNNDLSELKERAMCACILNDFDNYY